MPIEPLNTIDREGINLVFYFETDVEPNNNILEYKIYQNEEDVGNPEVPFFQFDVRILQNNEYKVDTMSALANDEFRQKGIAEALILRMQELHHGRIWSSSNNPNFKSVTQESRNPAASKVWHRIFLGGLASYVPDRFQYYLLEEQIAEDQIDLTFAKCEFCDEIIHNYDLESKINHVASKHRSLSNENETPVQLANRLFQLIP